MTKQCCKNSTSSISPQSESEPKKKCKCCCSKTKILLLIILVSCVSLYSCYRMKNYPVEFYGLLLDQNDNPISDVSITARVRGESPAPGFMWPVGFIIPAFVDYDRTIVRKTNNDGLFNIKGYHGTSLSYFENAFFKDEYEYVYDGNLNVFIFHPKSDSYFKPDPNKPVVFRMRKPEKTAYLLENETKTSIISN